MPTGLLVYDVKDAVLARLTALAAPGQPLAVIGDGTLVAYAWPGDQARQMAYMGAVHAVADLAVAEYTAALTREVDIIAVYLRAFAPGDDVRGVDQTVKAMAQAIIADLAGNPQLAGGLTWADWTAADGDYIATPNPEPSVTSVLRLQLTVTGLL